MPHPYIYTGFYNSRDKGSLMKLLPLDLRFPKCKLKNMHCGVVALDNTSRRKSDLEQPLDDVISFQKCALNSST